MGRPSILGISIFGALCGSLAFCLSKTEAQNATQPTTSSALVSRTFVLLTLTDNPPKFDEAAAADLQKRHLAHIAAMTAGGKVLVAGPFSNREDERLRGALIFNCAIDEARALANEDPAVKAGRLRVVCMTWNTSRDAMVFPKER
jgi:uncharacterized protein YciI